jgi:hypothetical protein
MEDIFLKPVQRSKEYLEALAMLGGSPDDRGSSDDLILSDVIAPEVEVAGELVGPLVRLILHHHGNIACGGSLPGSPAPLRSNWGRRFR